MEELLSISSDSLEKFLVRWYGEPDRPSRLVQAEAAGVRLPTELRGWFELVSRWSADVVTSSGPLEHSELFVDNGNLIFWVDGQDSWEWGVPLSGDNPSVIGRAVGSDWVPAQESLTEFLLHVTVLESMLGAPDQCYAHGVSAEQLSGIISTYSTLPLPTLPCPSMGAQIFVGSETLLQISASMSDLSRSRPAMYDVSVAATAPGPVDDTIEGYPGIPWKRYSEFVPPGFSPDDLPGFLR